MDIPEDPQERKKWMMQLLQDYGREFLIFEPEDQPNVFAAPEPEYRNLRSGNLDPRELRSWRYLDLTLQFLRERYGLFPDQHLVIDCPLHQLHPLEGERPEDFRKCFQLTAEATIKFRCRRSIGCRRKHCSAKNNRRLDLYDVVALLEKKGRGHARQLVSDFFEKLHGKKLGHFPKSEATGTSDQTTSSVMRYAVPKAALEKLFAVPMKGPGAAERFASMASGLIARSPTCEYGGHQSATGEAVLFSKAFAWGEKLRDFGPAARLFVWLHWKQAEAGSKLALTVPQLARQIGLNDRTLQKQKAVLQNLGYLNVDLTSGGEQAWSVRYNPGSGGDLW
ncbi:MAG: hypothetical protein FJY85_03640 [Deltaproteobacteria bacterium]|nr:hypothetical protein [Deltaproteobacteria bacterium]